MSPNELVNDSQPKNQKNTLNKITVITMVILIGVLTALFVIDNADKINFGDSKVDFSSAQHSFVPNTVGGFIGVNKDWETAVIQPIVYGFYTKDNKNYVQAAYLNNVGEEIYFDIVVSGEQNGKLVEDIWIKEPYREGKFVNFEELQQMIQHGEQVKISYLKKIPAQYISDTDFCKGLERLCNISTFTDEYRVFSISKELLQ